MLVGNGIVGLGVQVQDGHRVSEARLGRQDLQAGFKSAEEEHNSVILPDTNTRNNYTEGRERGEKKSSTYTSSSSQGASVIMIEQSLAVIETLYW